MKTTSKIMLVGLALVLGMSSAQAAAKKKPVKSAPEANFKLPGKTLISITPDVVKNWELGHDEHSTLSASAVSLPGRKDKAMALKYNLGGNGLWVSACLEGPFDLSDAGGLAFAYQGDGTVNSLEVKLEMSSEETFGKVLMGATKAEGWTVTRVPVSEFSYFWGGSSQTLNLSSMEVKKVCIAISKKPNDEGKTGKVLISDISKLSK